MSNLVLFTQRVEIVESYGERRDCADQRIAEFLLACGYLPIPIPNNRDIAEKMLTDLNPAGIVLTGGNSLVKYGGNASERDEVDKRLIEFSVKKELPLLGFCRGMQSILDYFGNDLVNVSGHVAVRHKIFGTDNEIEVNSYHNQACIELKTDNLKCIMHSDDGVIEKVTHNSLPIVGIMWHPEREATFRESDITMIKELFGEE